MYETVQKIIMLICVPNNLQNVCANYENYYKINAVMIPKFVGIHKVLQMCVDVCTYSVLIILHELNANQFLNP